MQKRDLRSYCPRTDQCRMFFLVQLGQHQRLDRFEFEVGVQ